MLWNAAKETSKYIEDNKDLIVGKTVLELGAGSGLPSFKSAQIGAKEVINKHAQKGVYI